MSNYKTVDNRIATVECNTRNNFIFKSFHLERNPCKDRGKQPMYKVSRVASKGPVKVNHSLLEASFFIVGPIADIIYNTTQYLAI